MSDLAELAHFLETLLGDLESNQLEVALIPSQDPETALRGGMIRCAISVNPPWYRKLCAKYQSSRNRKTSKSDTRLRRQTVLSVLRTLAKGKRSTSYLADELIALAQAMHDKWIQDYKDVPF